MAKVKRSQGQSRPRNRSVSYEVLFLEVPPELKRRIKVNAAANRRSMTAEAIILLESHPNLPQVADNGKQLV